MAQHFTINPRRLIKTLAIASPIAIAAGLGLGELHWQRHGATIEIPDMCITAEPTGETSVSAGACDVEPMPEA